MIARFRHLVAFFAALAVLLHAGMAAAQVFCAMTGTLSLGCCCPKEEAPEGPILKGTESCCRDALAGPATSLHQPQPLPAPTLAAAWAQVLPPEPAARPAIPAPAPAGTSPPLLALATIVLVR